ncbi:MAG: Gfo/Idh/MocA family oxidoreductase [Shimia thalassica]|uniref:Gfo/Idh/MocA family protein n=1 Tax=Shimia thalassica TaxID=1715693 RepID=UPI003298A5B0
MRSVAIIGCGFVADLYMRSFAEHADVSLDHVHDTDLNRLETFTNHWKLCPHETLQGFFDALPSGCVVLNLTNPNAHFEVSMACLNAGFSVYSEKPLAMEMTQATDLVETAKAKGLMLASAPCSMLGQASQMLGKAVREGVAGPVRLIYAELDDGFIPQAPYRDWKSETGAPWPSEDEFQVGCTLEHAGYYLTWLIGHFGSIRRVVAASAEVLPDKGSNGTPDVSIATLFFECGVVARLTCSIVAPHDHQIRVIGDAGVLKVDRAWDNAAPVKFHKRVRLRRRLLEVPLARRIRPPSKTHPKVGRWGAAAMNFALGPVEMLDAIAEGRPCRMSPELALHVNEVTLAIQNAGDDAGSREMQTRCDPVEPMPWAQ